ncbi:MAG TPA: M23 family metallopeptidase [Beijerinckiaceae bacterium]|nr:M23 family metallopeptidase [Beijerinckiaceae bacterium]
MTVKRQSPFDQAFGGLPALTLRSAAEPFLSRRAVNIRWLLAVVLLAGTAAALMASALYSALGDGGKLASEPVWFQPRTPRLAGDPESERGDRLSVAPAPVSPANNTARIEQLSDSGLEMLKFTRVTARLDRVPPAAPPRPASPPPPFVATATPAPSRADSTLPSLILSGIDKPILPAAARAYATPEDSSGWQPIARQLGAPLNVTDIPRSLHQQHIRRVVAAGAGDKVSAILTALDVASNDADEIASQLVGRSLFGEGKLSGGERIVVIENAAADDLPVSRPLKVRVEKTGQSPVVAALDDGGHYQRVASVGAGRGATTSDNSDDSPTLQQRPVNMGLEDSIAAVGQANQIDRSLIDEIARLCAHDVDLDSPVSAGDSIDFLYNTDSHGQPELAFVALTAAGRIHRYYRFAAPDDGSIDYYDANGHSVTKFLLRKPVADGRLNDGFGWRIHPILQDRRFHEGVDYDAPLGSPIAAAGAGVVEKIDYESGYGKYIRIRHDMGYETTYAHDEGFPRGLKVGDRVRQGQTIAYVGSTGLSTGSHLYYEVHINGRNVDPLSVRLPSGRILSGTVLHTFEQLRSRTDMLLAASSSPS